MQIDDFHILNHELSIFQSKYNILTTAIIEKIQFKLFHLNIWKAIEQIRLYNFAFLILATII